MPEELPPVIEKDATKANAEVAAKLAAQDLSGQSNAPEAAPEALDALDALAQAKTEENEKAAAAPVVEVTPAAPVQTEAEKKAVEDAAKKVEEEKKRVEDIFKDSPALPAGASPKSSEAFSAVKIKAAQNISALETKLAEAAKKLEEAEKKLLTPVPEALSKEVEELRAFRARLDVDADPAFKEFDKKVSASQEFIYAQLKKSPAVTDETIEKIKKLGGPEMVNLDKLFESIKDSTTQRIVESKIADIEQLKWQRELAVKSAKANIKQYVEERNKNIESSVTSHRSETQTHLDGIVKNLTWLAEKKDGDKATEDDKKATAAHNTFVGTVRGHLKAALEDDSPQMRAIMVAGMGQLLYVQRIYENSEAAHKKETDTLKAQLDEATKKIERLTKVSLSRRDSAAPTTGQLPQPKKDDIGVHAIDALDNIAKQIQEERARAAANGK